MDTPTVKLTRYAVWHVFGDGRPAVRTNGPVSWETAHNEEIKRTARLHNMGFPGDWFIALPLGKEPEVHRAS